MEEKKAVRIDMNGGRRMWKLGCLYKEVKTRFASRVVLFQVKASPYLVFKFALFIKSHRSLPFMFAEALI
jgi:hypothetical protein